MKTHIISLMYYLTFLSLLLLNSFCILIYFLLNSYIFSVCFLRILLNALKQYIFLIPYTKFESLCLLIYLLSFHLSTIPITYNIIDELTLQCLLLNLK